MSGPGLLCVLDRLARGRETLVMWLTMPTAAQDSRAGHGGEHPTHLHGSLLVAALLVLGGGRFPWGMAKPQMAGKYPLSFPKSPEFTPSPGLCLPCWLGTEAHECAGLPPAGCWGQSLP